MAVMFNIQGVAYDMLRGYGDNAVQEANKRAGEAKAKHDQDLEESWRQVAKAVVELDSKLPKIPG